MTPVTTMRGVGLTYLVGGDREGINVAFLRGVAICEAELGGVQQFRGHVTDNPRLGRCRAAGFHNFGVGNDTRDSEVPKARIAVLGDQDVPLDMTGPSANVSAQNLVTHWMDITVHYARRM